MVFGGFKHQSNSYVTHDENLFAGMKETASAGDIRPDYGGDDG